MSVPSPNDVYQWQRRADEVISSIQRFTPNVDLNILNMGTPESLVIERIKEKIPSARCVSLELSHDPMGSHREHAELTRETPMDPPDKRYHFVQGDAMSLPYRAATFDVIVATFVMEHVPIPIDMLKECHRILKPNGIISIMAPDPFWDSIVSMISTWRYDHPGTILNLETLSSYLVSTGFKPLFSDRFMFSETRFPFES